MAQVQLLRHAKQEQAQSQVLEQRQSFEIVQTMLSVAFASIFYLRDLLPDMCFENRDFSSIRQDSHWHFQDFLAGNVPAEIGSAEANGLPEATKHSPGKMMIIAKGKSAVADKVLSWLDGIFDALRRNFLSGIQISIILDDDKPMNVIESYVFKFSYKSASPHSQPQLDGIVLESPQNKNITIKNARAGLQLFSRCVNSLVQHLPFLPEKRYLTVHLSYTDICPLDYDPPGFYTERSSSMMVPDSDLWKMSEVKGGKMDVGFYKYARHSENLPAADLESANLTVHHLVPSQPAELHPDDELVIPSSMDHPKEVPRFHLRTSVESANPNGSTQDHAETAISPVVEATQRLSQLVEEELELPQLNGHGRNGAKTNTRDAYEIMIRQRLDNMLYTSSVPRDGLTTQPWTQIEDGIIPKIWDLKEPHKERLIQKACETASKRNKGSKVKVACECGSGREEGALLACDGCDYWKHQHCYGIEASSTPEIFFCYFCLTENLEGSLYLELMQLAKQRRTLWIMRRGGKPSSGAALGKMLNCSERKAREVVKQLKMKNLLKAPSSQISQSQNPTLGQYSVDEKVLRTALEPDGVFHRFVMLSEFYVLVPMKNTTQRSSGMSQNQEPAPPKTITELTNMIDEHIDETQSMRPGDTTDEETDELRAYEPATLGVIDKFFKPNSASTSQEQIANQISRSMVNQKKRPHSEEQVTPRRSKRQLLSTRSPIDCSGWK